MKKTNKTIIKLGQIDFTNCLPINYTFEIWNYKDITLENAVPTSINKLMQDNKIDVAPVSSIEYLKNTNKYTLLDNICISSYGEVGSVILFSNYELKDLDGKKIGLPYSSASSIALLKILLLESKVNINNVHFVTHKYESTLQAALAHHYDAVLYIGDPALVANIQNKEQFKKYDLGSEWYNLTGYPMIFGTWVARSEWKLEQQSDFDRIKFLLDKAVDEGLNIYLNDVISLASKKLTLDPNHIHDYLTDKIKYSFTDQHKASLKLFQELYNKLSQ